MNISCHTFVPTRQTISLNGNFLAWIDYLKLFNPLTYPIRPFPYDGGRYAYKPTFISPIVSWTLPPFACVPYSSNDSEVPKHLILLYY